MFNSFFLIYLFNEYFFILLVFLIAIIIAIVLFFVSFLIGNRLPDREKVSPYECGFSPFEDARQKFDVKFYLVSILFIVFDLEVAYLFPWSLVLYNINFFGFWTMFIFLFILTIGFVYEWLNGALEWN